MLESDFQARVQKKLRIMFPGCIIVKVQTGYIQGIPDRLVIWNDRWAFLEFKKSANAEKQPNQEWYVDKLDKMSFAAFIFPENEEEVLRDLQQAFQLRR